jgi:hypothetical protein
MPRMASYALVLVLTLGLFASGALAARVPSKSRLVPGQLELSGTGAVTLTGELTAFGVIPEEGGVLYVQDLRGDATVTLNGARQALKGRRVNLKRAQGSFYIKGSKVNARVQGNNLSLSAAGRGRASVAGIGTFVLNGAEPQDWPPGFAVIELLPPTK